jgi:hypothetical protein
MNRLLRNATTCGLKIRTDVAGDGNCFYHCIRDQLLRLEKNHDVTASELRRKLVSFMQKLVSKYLFFVLFDTKCKLKQS